MTSMTSPPQPTGARIRVWIRDHPTAADALLGLALLVIALIPTTFGDSSERLSPDQVFPWMVPAACLLVLRRRFPWQVWISATILGCAGAAIAEGPTPAYVPAVIALYTVSTRSSTIHTVLAIAASAVMPALLIALTGVGDPLDMLVYGMSMWSGLAGILGIAVKAQRDVIAAAHERTRQAEASREEEAHRRVVEERLRIARELHDIVAHHVAVISVQAGVAGHLLRTDPDGATEAIEHVRRSSKTVLKEVPGLLGLLRTDTGPLEVSSTPRLDELPGLIDHARQFGLDVVLHMSGAPVTLRPAVELAAYRVLQEALTNAGRYSDGTVVVRVDFHPADLTLEVRNTRAQRPHPATSGGHGLIGIRERVASVGGEVTAGPDAAGTWMVRASLPIGEQMRETTA